jgi:HPt (histidine-containing phosphotransfer) domain-containing protein
MRAQPMSAQEVAERMAQLRREYRAKLPLELQQLQALGRDFAAAGASETEAVLRELEHRLHKLSGSGASFGLPLLSQHTRVLEQRIAGWLVSGAAAQVAHSERQQLLQALQRLPVLLAP